jgi:hypothetical protein
MRAPRLCTRLARGLRAREGAVAIEAALLIPLLFVGLAVLVDAVRYVRAAARMDRVAAQTADLVARSEKVVDRVDFNAPTGTDELGMFFLVANKVAAPSNLAGHGQVIVTSITPNAGGFTQNWQRTGPYALTEPSRIASLPPLPTGGALIVAEVFYDFDSLILDTLGILSPTTLRLYRRAVFRPRLGTLETLVTPS